MARSMPMVQGSMKDDMALSPSSTGSKKICWLWSCSCGALGLEPDKQQQANTWPQDRSGWALLCPVPNRTRSCGFRLEKCPMESPQPKSLGRRQDRQDDALALALSIMNPEQRARWNQEWQGRKPLGLTPSACSVCLDQQRATARAFVGLLLPLLTSAQFSHIQEQWEAISANLKGK